MLSIGIKDPELRKLSKKLKQLPTKLQDKIVVHASKKVAMFVKNEAKKRVPVRTGFLKKSIGIKKVSKRKLKDGAIVYRVGIRSKIRSKNIPIRSGKPLPNAFYGAFVEKGTKKMKAKPFLLPALMSNEDKLLSIWKNEFKNKFEKEVGE